MWWGHGQDYCEYLTEWMMACSKPHLGGWWLIFVTHHRELTPGGLGRFTSSRTPSLTIVLHYGPTPILPTSPPITDSYLSYPHTVRFFEDSAVNTCLSTYGGLHIEVIQQMFYERMNESTNGKQTRTKDN